MVGVLHYLALRRFIYYRGSRHDFNK